MVAFDFTVAFSCVISQQPNSYLKTTVQHEEYRQNTNAERNILHLADKEAN